MTDFCKLGYSHPRIMELSVTERLKYVRYIIKTDRNLQKSVGISDENKKKHMRIFIDSYFNSLEKKPQ